MTRRFIETDFHIRAVSEHSARGGNVPYDG